MIPRILKIDQVDGANIHCLFNSGEYRIINLDDFVSKYKLQSNATLEEIVNDDDLIVVVKDGTLSFPAYKKSIKLESGKEFQVDFDLDPVMLYESSHPDDSLNQNYLIGKLLKSARKKVGLTQEELANRVGTSKGYISRIENDRTDIALKTLRRIVEVGLNKRIAIVD